MSDDVLYMWFFIVRENVVENICCINICLLSSVV